MTTPDELLAAHSADKIGIMMGLELGTNGLLGPKASHRKWKHVSSPTRRPPPASGIELIADVYDYVCALVGIDHIGIGLDFDGMGLYPSGWHPAMRDVSRLPALLEEFRARGWRDEDLSKLAGENFLRVWRETLARPSDR